MDFLAPIYLWLKAGHVIFVIFWMAGLFMLPRQMIYMHPSAPGSQEEALWVRRTGLLRKIILVPSLIVVWVLGLIVMSIVDAHVQAWFQIKFALVIALTGYHGWLVMQAKKMAGGARPLSERALRLWGEIPGIAVAVIVVLAIVKPFG